MQRIPWDERFGRRRMPVVELRWRVRDAARHAVCWMRCFELMN
jgi:hypothetical protein